MAPTVEAAKRKEWNKPMGRGRKTIIALFGVLAFELATASTASAGDYNTPGGSVLGSQTGGGGGAAGVTLPFTGADLLAYLLVGIAIIASGIAVRVATRR
jgi:hypothetical protein